LVRVRSTWVELVCSFSHFRFLPIDSILPKREESRRVVRSFPLSSPMHPRRLHLRRGPLVSPGPIQSMDDRATIRSLLFDFRWVIACMICRPLEFWAARCVRRYCTFTGNCPPRDACTMGECEFHRSVSSLYRRSLTPLCFPPQCIVGGDHYTTYLWSGKVVVFIRV
jgi:hypothetical protein